LNVHLLYKLKLVNTTFTNTNADPCANMLLYSGNVFT